MNNDDLIRDFLACGGEVKKLPAKRVRRDTLKPEVHKKREMLAGLLDRAREIRS
jgi:hypothetical protein